jgi:hypothetical protein
MGMKNIGYVRIKNGLKTSKQVDISKTIIQNPIFG